MLNISIYELEGVYLTEVTQFFFISKGKRIIRKIIQYNLQGVFQGKEYYNLGFGDYSEEEDNFIDNICSNNGDTYKIFNTILYSITLFFELNPNVGIIISGSNVQRIEIYKWYLHKNLKSFTKNYTFFGKNKKMIDFIPYSVDKNIDQILFFKKF